MKLILTLIILLIIIKLLFDNKTENFNQEINYETEYQVALAKDELAKLALSNAEAVATSSAAVAKAASAASTAVSAVSKVAQNKANSENNNEDNVVSSEVVAKASKTAATATTAIAEFTKKKADTDKEEIVKKTKEKEEAEAKVKEAKTAVDKNIPGSKESCLPQNIKGKENISDGPLNPDFFSEFNSHTSDNCFELNGWKLASNSKTYGNEGLPAILPNMNNPPSRTTVPYDYPRTCGFLLTPPNAIASIFIQIGFPYPRVVTNFQWFGVGVGLDRNAKDIVVWTSNTDFMGDWNNIESKCVNRGSFTIERGVSSNNAPNMVLKQDFTAYKYIYYQVKNTWGGELKLDRILMNYPPGIIIFSEAEYKGKSLFLKANGIYEKKFFDAYWGNTSVGSYKNNDGNSPYMIGFDLEGGGGTSTETNLDNWRKVFGPPEFRKFNIKGFSVWTPNEWKKHWCKSFEYKHKYGSHWPNVNISSECIPENSNMITYTELPKSQW
jgi:hypothetical protein